MDHDTLVTSRQESHTCTIYPSPSHAQICTIVWLTTTHWWHHARWASYLRVKCSISPGAWNDEFFTQLEILEDDLGLNTRSRSWGCSFIKLTYYRLSLTPPSPPPPRSWNKKNRTMKTPQSPLIHSPALLRVIVCLVHRAMRNCYRQFSPRPLCVREEAYTCGI